MVRTQIQLSEEQQRRLKALSVKKAVSISELIRRGIDQVLVEYDREEQWSRLWEVCGSCHDPSGASDVGGSHDNYLAEIYK